jgi:hypothetical protein
VLHRPVVAHLNIVSSPSAWRTESRWSCCLATVGGRITPPDHEGRRGWRNMETEHCANGWIDSRTRSSSTATPMPYACRLAAMRGGVVVPTLRRTTPSSRSALRIGDRADQLTQPSGLLCVTVVWPSREAYPAKSQASTSHRRLNENQH